MRVLVISSTPWARNNSFGSTFSNFFEGMEDVEIANVYCKPGRADGAVVSRAFCITEAALVANLKNKSLPAGIETEPVEGVCTEKQFPNIAGYDIARKTRLQLFLWGRELIWKLGRWKSQELFEFIDGFKPDIIFQPVYDSFYLTRLALTVQEYTKIPMLGFIGDDVYTLKQFRLSPLYWADRLLKRVSLKRLITRCKKIYVMTRLSKEEYDRVFKINCAILTKGLDFYGEAPIKRQYLEPLKFVYTGNINVGRWKALAALGRALSCVGAEGERAQLHIYTFTPLTKRMRSALELPAVKLMGSAPADRMKEIQGEADVLVHAEATELRERLLVRLSFSTKLVDYMQRARCILAIGSDSVASIQHLKTNNAAIVATDEKQLQECVCKLLNNSALLDEYAVKAWNCGKENHQRDKTQRMLYNDMYNAINGIE